MKKVYPGLAAATLLALSACGGSGEDAAANNALTTEVPAEDLTLPADNGLLPADEVNGLGADLNAVDANASANLNASDNVTNSY